VWPNQESARYFGFTYAIMWLGGKSECHRLRTWLLKDVPRELTSSHPPHSKNQR